MFFFYVYVCMYGAILHIFERVSMYALQYIAKCLWWSQLAFTRKICCVLVAFERNYCLKTESVWLGRLGYHFGTHPGNLLWGVRHNSTYMIVHVFRVWRALVGGCWVGDAWWVAWGGRGWRPGVTRVTRGDRTAGKP